MKIVLTPSKPKESKNEKRKESGTSNASKKSFYILNRKQFAKESEEEGSCMC